MKSSIIRFRIPQQGFSLLEMMFATVILLVGLVAVAQLVPASVLLNYRNRMDSTALVFAQRELDQMVDQPLTSTSFIDNLGNACQLGTPPPPPTPPNPPSTYSVLGNNVVSFNNETVIDFTSGPVSGYSFTYRDPTDPNGFTYDVRWAVIVSGSSTAVDSKRFILGVRQIDAKRFFLPITLDTMVTR